MSREAQEPPVSAAATRVFERVRGASCAAALLIAALVVCGWAAGVPALAGRLGGHTTMKVNTAIAVACLAGAVLVLARRPRSVAGRALPAAAALIAALVLAEYVFGTGLGIDQLLAHDSSSTRWPGRTAANSAAAILATAAAQLLVLRARRALVLLGQGLALASVVVVGAAIVGLTSHTPELYGSPRIAYMSIPTMVALGAVAIATVLLRFDLGLGRVVVQADVEGTLLRVFLPLAVAVPIALGFARDVVLRLGADQNYVRWAYTLAVVLVLAAGVTLAARAVGRSARAAAVVATRLGTIVEASPLAVITLDTELNVTSWNPAAERMLGWSADEIVGRRYPLAGEEQWSEVEEHKARVLEGVFFLESERRRKDGSTLWVRFSAAPLTGPAGEVEGILAVVADVTERVHAEEQLRQLNDELELRVLERTAQLSAANEELQAFSYSVSHDLRAPLRALGGFSEALVEDYGPKLDDRARDYLVRIQSAAVRMSDLIDDVLALSRVSRSEIVRREVDLTALARELCAQAAAAEPLRDVALAIEPGMVAVADPVLVRQALQNLIENAWKFTAPVAHARVEVGCRDVDGIREFFVADNGVGFDEGYADKLFQPFQRLHATSDFAGNGVGLATVRNIVKRHGGSVRAESRGAGARFSFTLEPAASELRDRQPQSQEAVHV